MLTRCLKRILLSTGLLAAAGLCGCNGHRSAVVDGPYDTLPPSYTVSEPLESQQKLVPQATEPRPLWNRLGAPLRDAFDRMRGWKPNIRRSAAFHSRPVTGGSALPSATRTKSVTFPMTDSHETAYQPRRRLETPEPLKNVNPTGPKLFTP